MLKSDSIETIADAVMDLIDNPHDKEAICMIYLQFSDERHVSLVDAFVNIFQNPEINEKNTTIFMKLKIIGEKMKRKQEVIKLIREYFKEV